MARMRQLEHNVEGLIQVVPVGLCVSSFEEFQSNDPEEESSDELSQRSRQGDHSAFSQLFDLQRERLRGEIDKRLNGPLQRRVDASDVVQELFLDADRRLDEVAQSEIPLDVWLRILLKQKIVDLQRRHVFAAKRSVARERYESDTKTDRPSPVSQFVSQDSSPSAGLHRDEQSVQIKTALGLLNQSDREILELRHFEGMSNGQAAETLGISVNAASNRYIRALGRFRQMLDTQSDP